MIEYEKLNLTHWEGLLEISSDTIRRWVAKEYQIEEGKHSRYSDAEMRKVCRLKNRLLVGVNITNYIEGYKFPAELSIYTCRKTEDGISVIRRILKKHNILNEMATFCHFGCNAPYLFENELPDFANLQKDNRFRNWPRSVKSDDKVLVASKNKNDIPTIMRWSDGISISLKEELDWIMRERDHCENKSKENSNELIKDRLEELNFILEKRSECWYGDSTNVYPVFYGREWPAQTDNPMICKPVVYV